MTSEHHDEHQSVTVVSAPILLIPNKIEKDRKEDSYVSLDLLTDPGNRSSSKIEKKIRVFTGAGPEATEDYVKWRIAFGHVQVAKPLPTAISRYSMARTLLSGEALSMYETKVNEIGEVQTLETFDLVLNEMSKNYMTPSAARQQKKYLKYVMKKPEGMTIRDFVTRVKELNNYLKYFPAPDNVPLTNDDLAEAVENALPDEWKIQLLRQSYMAIDHTLEEFLQRLFNYELADFAKKTMTPRTPSTLHEKQVPPDDAKHGSETPKSNKVARDRGDRPFLCAVHGKNRTHATNDCRSIASLKKASRNGDFKTERTNQNRKRGEQTSLSVEEINTIIEKKLTALNKAEERGKKKKRRIEYLDRDSSDDSDQ